MFPSDPGTVAGRQPLNRVPDPTVPSPEEVAAVAAAVEIVFSRPASDMAVDDRPPAWRFSGRWWARPIAARRERPW